MTIIEWTCWAVGIGLALIALLFAIFSYFNKRGHRKINVLSKSIGYGLLTIIFVYIIGLSTFVEWESKKDESADLNKERDVIIAKQYRMALSMFLAKFRIYLVCLPDYKSLEKDIIEIFDPDHPKRAVMVSKITSELIEKLFTSHYFSKPVSDNCHFEANKQPVTVADLFLYEIGVLNKSCSKILQKYASAGNPKLILKIEIMKNRADNLMSPYRSKNFSKLKKDDLRWISEFFVLIKQSYEYINEIIPNSANK